MTHHIKTGLIPAALLLVFSGAAIAQSPVFNQNSSRSNNRSYNQNSARSNHAKMMSSGFGFQLTPQYGFNMKGANTDSLLFRGNGPGFKIDAGYSFGNFGIGFSSGFVSSQTDKTKINEFLAHNGIPFDQMIINTGSQQNMYALLGPTASFGNKVHAGVHAKGGLFINNGGFINIKRQGAINSVYRNEPSSKSIYPGFTAGINLDYHVSDVFSIGFGTDYLNTKTEVINYDIRRGAAIEGIRLSKNITNIMAGINIRYTIGSPKDAATSLATGIQLGKPKYEDIKTKDMGRELSTGKSEAQFNPKEYTINKRYQPGRPVYGNREINQSCGPVTVKKTYPDGTIEEKTFACTNDASEYARQTQQSSFGEKVQSGLAQTGNALANGVSKQGIIHRDLAARNILVGRVTWTTTSQSSNGIVTNRSAANNRNGVATGAGAAAGAATINNTPDSKGIATRIYVRDAASGMASGKRTYQFVYADDNSATCTTCMASVVSNPLYQDNDNSGTNPLYEGKNNSRTSGDDDCDGVAGINVFLIDANTNATVAATQTESCGEFFFANVPSGNYIVKTEGSISAKKSYEILLKGKMDLAGEMLAAEDYWSINLVADTGSVEYAQAVIKTKTKSNQSNDRIGSTSSLVWSPRSNKTMNITTGDLDGDGEAEMIVGGALPGGAVISAALRFGDPIKGLNVKVRRLSGSNLRTTQTDEFGAFEFPGMEEGGYKITADLNYYINDETLITLGDDVAQNIVTSESGLESGKQEKMKGDVKITASQNSQSLKTGINSGMPNRISMNVTVPKQTQGATFGERTMDNDSTGNEIRAQNNNTVRSNRTDNAIIIADLDGDGEMESSYLNINGEIATISITEPGVGAMESRNTAGGINITEPGAPKTNQKRTSNIGPVKWMSPEVISKKVWGDPHVDEKSGTLKLGSGNFGEVYKGKWKHQDVAIKAVRCSDGACVAITAKGYDYPEATKISLNGLPPGQPVIKAAFWFVDANGKTYKKETDATGRLSLNGLPPGIPLRIIANMGTDGNEDILLLLSTDAQGTPVCNVLKTKHDTVKNSIGNIR